MNNIQTAIEELDKLSRYIEIIESPEEFFQHMQGHTTELSLVLNVFSIAEIKNDIKAACEKQIPKKPEYTDEDARYYDCPTCRESIFASDDFGSHKHCLSCGQAISWEEEHEGEKAEKAAVGEEE